jgi:tetratricopeptide (TPR) repeat protein
MEKAEELIKKAITLTPEHRAYCLDTFGVVLLRMGRTTESITAFKEALELMPRNNAGYLAETYLHSGSIPDRRRYGKRRRG